LIARKLFYLIRDVTKSHPFLSSAKMIREFAGLATGLTAPCRDLKPPFVAPPIALLLSGTAVCRSLPSNDPKNHTPPQGNIPAVSRLA